MEFWQGLLELTIRTAIWASCAYLLGRFLIFKLEKHFGEAAGRIRKIGGAEFDPPVMQQQVEDPTNPITRLADEQQVGGGQALEAQLNVVQLHQLGNVRNWVATLEPAQKDDQIAIALANYQLSWQFEALNSQIFGSQLSLLTQSNAQAITDAHARVIFDSAKAFYPAHAHQEYDNWVGWLISTELLIRQNEYLVITEYGREFLRYIVGRGYSFTRPN